MFKKVNRGQAFPTGSSYWSMTIALSSSVVTSLLASSAIAQNQNPNTSVNWQAPVAIEKAEIQLANAQTNFALNQLNLPQEQQNSQELDFPITSVIQLADAENLNYEENSVSEPLEDEFSATDSMSQVTPVSQFSDAIPDSQNFGFSEDPASGDPMNQVTNVNQLRDVSPGDWAYEALRNLVETYGCIAGYPDGTFRGNRAMTRYEFAAGLNACLQQIERLIAAATADLVSKEDLEILQRLGEEFEAELATLGSRVDNLEGRTAFLEEHQFSTTTKLFGFAWFNATASTSGGDIKRETGNRVVRGSRETEVQEVDDPEPTFSGLVWLDFVSSFTGRDQLVLQLSMGSTAGFPGPLANSYSSAGFEYSTADFTDQGGSFIANQVTLRELYYQFPVGDSLQFVVGPRFNFFRFFEGNQFSFAFQQPLLFNYITFNSANSTLVNAIDRGAGAIMFWDISDQLLLKLGYIGETNEYLPSPPFNSASNPGQGLFNGTNTLTAELTYRVTDNANIRFLYTRTNIQGIRELNRDGVRQLAGGITEPLIGVADDGFGGDVGNATADTFGLNFDWLITPKFGIFGRYTYGKTNIFPRDPDIDDGSVEAQAFHFGLAFPDLLKEGSIAQLSFILPYDILSGRRFLVSGNGDGGTWYEVEGSYFLPLTNNIALVPSFSVVSNANNFSDNSTIFIGNLRTQFNF